MLLSRCGCCKSQNNLDILDWQLPDEDFQALSELQPQRRMVDGSMFCGEDKPYKVQISHRAWWASRAELHCCACKSSAYTSRNTPAGAKPDLGWALIHHTRADCIMCDDRLYSTSEMCTWIGHDLSESLLQSHAVTGHAVRYKSAACWPRCMPRFYDVHFSAALLVVRVVRLLAKRKLTAPHHCALMISMGSSKLAALVT
jgi:hypothetical protein